MRNLTRPKVSCGKRSSGKSSRKAQPVAKPARVSSDKPASGKSSRKAQPVAKPASAMLESKNVEASRYESQLLAALQAVCEGDFSVRLPSDWSGLSAQIADTTVS